MNLIRATLFISMLAVGCSRQICPPTTAANQKLFQDDLRIMTDVEEGRKSVLVDDYLKAHLFISAVTGVFSKAGYSSTIGYQNKDDYKNDMKQWKDWYKKKKCVLTDSYLDSVFEIKGRKLEDFK